jgi:hypothetical protein
MLLTRKKKSAAVASTRRANKMQDIKNLHQAL